MVVLCEVNQGHPTNSNLFISRIGWDFLHSYLLVSKSMLPAWLCLIVHFVSSSNSRVPQEAVTAGFLDEVYWSFRSVSHLCRQDDEAVGYQFCHHCEWGVSRTCRNRYKLLQKIVSAIKMEKSCVLSFVFQPLGDLFGHRSKISFEN